MEYSRETHRYLAKVSRIGIIGAILYALIHGFLQVFLTYGFKFRFYLLTAGAYNVIPELAVAGVGLAALLVCGILSLVLRGKPSVAQTAWIVAGKAVLLAAPVGYIRSQLLRYWSSSNQMDFLTSFAILATVFVGYAWSMRPHDGLTDNAEGVRPRRILRGTAIVGGIMLISVLWLLLMQWDIYRSWEHLSADQKLEYMLWVPLNATLPVALSVTVGYPLLSLAARWDEAPRKGRFGKGTILLGWVTVAISVWHQIMAVMIQTRILDYTAGSLMGDLQDLQNMQAMQQIIATVGTLLGIWTLCGILSRVKESKAALWGARGLLGMIVLRNLFSWILDATVSIIQMKKQSSGMGIIGGADYTLTVLTAKLESWANILFTILTIAALCILTVGLTRRCRVSKAFWAVPVLTAATVGVSLLVAIIWELFLRNTSLETLEVIRTVFLTVIPAALTVACSLMGVLTLARTPAEEIPSIPTASNTEEPPKPRMEDYLYQL